MAVARSLLALSLLTSVSLSFCSPLAKPRNNQTLLRHESRSLLPDGFSLISPASPENTVHLRLGLTQKDPNGMLAMLETISDPESPQYGQYLTMDELSQFVSPKSESLQAVNIWLQEHGLTSTVLSPSGDWLGIELPVSEANSLLDADFAVFKHADTGLEAVRTLAYSIPSSLKEHVDLIFPTTSFPEPIPLLERAHTKRAFNVITTRASKSPCSDGTTPACLQDLYKIPRTPAKNRSNRLAITGRHGNQAHYAFLKQFLKMYRPDMNPSTSFSVVSVDDGDNDQDAPSVSEGELDIQYTVGLATGVTIEYVTVGIHWQDGDLEGYLDEINQLLSVDEPPQVLTTSYGFSEDSMSFALTDKLCKAYAQLGARGTSVIFASGDTGAGCSRTKDKHFVPTFPSNCPYVTSVGGTEGFAPERGWSGSSGGFSNYYTAPSYQVAAVSSYLRAIGSQNKGLYNASGRAFPDVSTKADAFQIWEAGHTVPMYGTSASSPAFASIIALLNDRLASAGKPQLGFLNPWLYGKAATAFTDITAGDNKVDCGSGKTAGWTTTKGWDPVTGLGTPLFEKLLKAAGL